MSNVLNPLAIAVKLAPVMLYHSVAMLVQPSLKPEQLSQQQLATISGLADEQLQGCQWQPVHQGTSARWRLQLPQVDKTFFTKTNPPDFPTRFLGAVFRLGLNELGFYRDIQPHLTVPTPFSHGLWGNRYRYLIIIDDLQGQAEFSDVTTRCDLTRAQSVIDTLANLHASCWSDKRFSHQWRWVNRQQYKRNHAFLTMLRQHSSLAAVKRYRELLPQGIPEMAKKINKAYPGLEQQWGAGDRTLVHGDAHIGNMFFLPDGTTGLLDWQVLGFEQGMRDVTYFLINSLPTELRKKHQHNLIERYVNALQVKGINFNLPLALEQYQLHAPYVWISSAVTAASTTMQEQKIAAAGLVRASRAMIDLDISNSIG